MKKWLVRCLLIILVIKVSHAQEIELGQIVVTPHRTATSVDIEPFSLEVLNVKEASKKGEFTLPEVLKDISDLGYATTSQMGEASVFIRGADTRHTQVLLEGIKLYDPASTAGYFYAYNYIDLFPFQRVEVAKGPFSSLYGSDSIGGTINLITKKGKGNPSFSYLQKLGSYATFKEAFIYQGEINKFSYFLFLSKTDVNSFYAQKYKEGNHERDPYHNFNSSLRLDYSFGNDLDITFLNHYIYSKYEYDASSSDDDDNIAHFHQGVSGIKIQNALSEDISQEFQLGFTRTYRKHWESSSVNYWYDGKTYQVKYKLDSQLLDSYKIILGMDYLREKGEGKYSGSSSPDKSTTNSKGYYLENIFTPFLKFFISASYRLEDHSNFGTAGVFNASASYIIENTSTKIKASFGKGFKAPSLYQLYSFYGEPNLTPEKSESYQVGIEQNLFKNLKFSSTYFHTHLSNLIDFNTTTWKYYNAGKAKIQGWENKLEYSLSKEIKIKFSYANIDAEKKEDGSRLLRRPKNKAVLALTVLKNRFRIYPELTYVGNRIDSGGEKLKAYFLATLSLSFELNKDWDFFIRLENLLDKDYELVNGYQSKKFCWYIGTKVKF
ncbi:MAG: hypothetical protein DRP81_01650 [Candidatus Omnitrophota bacterium]|nr:MAG: hypothetical protein DRP81_01650 [Candidatus Omnitrophota bacterium]